MARQHLQRSVELNPEFGKAWDQLAATYLTATPIPAEAITAARTAHRLLPSRSDIALRLLQLLTSSGAIDEARQLLDSFFGHQATAEELAKAQKMVTRGDIYALAKLIESRQWDAALSRLEPYLTESGQDQLQGLEGLVEYYGFETRYQIALGLYQEKQFARAAELFEVIIPTSPDEDKKRKAEGMLRLTKRELASAEANQ